MVLTNEHERASYLRRITILGRCEPVHRIGFQEWAKPLAGI